MLSFFLLLWSPPPHHPEKSVVSRPHRGVLVSYALRFPSLPPLSPPPHHPIIPNPRNLSPTELQPPSKWCSSPSAHLLDPTTSESSKTRPLPLRRPTTACLPHLMGSSSRRSKHKRSQRCSSAMLRLSAPRLTTAPPPMNVCRSLLVNNCLHPSRIDSAAGITLSIWLWYSQEN